MRTNFKTETAGTGICMNTRHESRRCSSLSTSALVLLLTIDPCALHAAALSEAKVGKAVETWVRRVTADRRPDAKIGRVEPHQKKGDTTAHIIHLAGGGYCLAGADSLALPVYWYCPQGTYDPLNPETQFILEEINARTEYLRLEKAKGGASLEAHQETLDKRAALWDALEAGDSLLDGASAKGGDQLVLPVTSRWHQGSPYNDACPEIPAGSGNHAVVGCVATAMAQVMYYWQWPSSYHWNLLHDVHADPVDAGDVEVARLCHDAGLAVGMSYGTSESGADPAQIPGALADHYQFDSDAVFEGRTVARMVDEIKWLRPVLLGGRNSADEGHRWLVYGYNLSTSPWQFMMNLGWGGASGWYSVDQVPSGLTLSQTHVTRVAPRTVVRFVGASSSGDGSPSSPYRNIEEARDKVSDHATLIFKADSDNMFVASSVTLARPLILKGVNATIRRQ